MIAWTGYDTPGFDLSMATTTKAELGADLLRTFQDGLVPEYDHVPGVLDRIGESDRFIAGTR